MKRTGFTLIELMIVIAILGIVSAVVFTSWDKIKSKNNGSHTTTEQGQQSNQQQQQKTK